MLEYQIIKSLAFYLLKLKIKVMEGLIILFTFIDIVILVTGFAMCVAADIYKELYSGLVVLLLGVLMMVGTWVLYENYKNELPKYKINNLKQEKKEIQNQIRIKTKEQQLRKEIKQLKDSLQSIQ